MTTTTCIVTEVHTNTIYMSESFACDVRRNKSTHSTKLFRHFKNLYPTAKIVCLSDKEFDARFKSMATKAMNQFSARFVLSKEYSEQTVMHFQKIS